MKLRKSGQVALAAVVGIGCSFGITSCVQSHTVGYLYVTGHQYNQVGVYKITNNTGNLTQIYQPVGSGGINPVDAITAQAGKFLYVLNSGCADPSVYPTAKYQCTSGETPTASSIELFTIGGDGVLTPQANYLSKGENSVAISLDSTGSYLYVLDQNTPSGAGTFTPAQYAADGDVSVFAIDTNTGRLSVQQNLQVQGTNNQQLQVFPVGVGPTWFRLFSSYLFTIDRNTGASANPTFVNVYSTGGTGQLLQTQNAEFPTGAVNLTYVSSGSSYLYLLDAGEPGDPSSPLYNGAIYAYTVSGGTLSSIVGGSQTQASQGFTSGINPTLLTVDSTSKFVYVANAGPNTSINQAASNVSSYFIQPGGQLSSVAGTGNTGSVTPGSGGTDPRCLIEDPSNQYLFTVNFDGSTVVGQIINTEAGSLSAQRGTGTKTAPGQPTWCVASGNVF